MTSSIPEMERESLVFEDSERGLVCSVCLKLTGLSVWCCSFCLARLAQATMESYRRALGGDERITKTPPSADRHPADELCILSAMCMAKLSSRFYHHDENTLKNPARSYALQATVLLEYAWSHSKANFLISLLLVRLYSNLGCGSLAMRAYLRLGVKQIQHDTLAHYMFDGISSMHPHPFSSNPDDSSQRRSPIEHFEIQQKVYARSTDQISKNRWVSFEHSNYNSIFEFEEVGEKLANSLSAVMSVIESRKISRLAQPDIPLTASSCGGDILRV
jgi:N-terminal acetyltransferase B complex non-catalytic subunit